MCHISMILIVAWLTYLRRHLAHGLTVVPFLFLNEYDFPAHLSHRDFGLLVDFE